MAQGSKKSRETLAALLRDWQPRSHHGKKIALSKFDPGAKPLSSGDKRADGRAIEALAIDIDRLQDLLFADKRFKVLVVLQGLDAAGKDGTIRHVFGRVSPLGVQTASWKAPTPDERAHDFLWRIHQRVPAAGDLVIFNRSHYEDVLVPAVNGDLKPQQVQVRLRQINDFERMLSENGTVLLKFMLHISPDEQCKRLQARLDDPAKAWKFRPDDLQVRQQWPAYMRAYETLLNETSTDIAPWTIVPADSKTHRNLMIGTVVREALNSLGLRYPPPDPRLAGLKVE